jgi:tetratricopeptide (TPR) repeat protein
MNRIILVIIVFVPCFLNLKKATAQDSSFFFLKAYNLMAEEKYEDAIRVFDASIQKGYMLGYSYGYKAKCEAIVLRTEQGSKNLDTAFMYLPSDYLLFGFRAFQYRMTGQFDSLIYFAKKSLELKPTYKNTLELLAEGFTVLEKFDSARYYLQRAIDLNPSDWELVHTLGKIDMAEGDYEIAIVRFQYCIKKLPQNVIAKLDIAYCKFKQKKYDEATEICNSMIVLYPEIQRSYYLRGNIYCELGNLEKACKDYRKLNTFDKLEKLANENLQRCKCK